MTGRPSPSSRSRLPRHWGGRTPSATERDRTLQAVNATKQQLLEEAQQKLAQTQAELEKEKASRDVLEARLAQSRAVLSRETLIRDLPEGTVITLPGGQLFARGRSRSAPGGRDRLSRVADFLKSASRSARVAAQPPSRGSRSAALALSGKRADRVRDFLVDAGVTPEQIRAEASAGKAPVHPLPASPEFAARRGGHRPRARHGPGPGAAGAAPRKTPSPRGGSAPAAEISPSVPAGGRRPGDVPAHALGPCSRDRIDPACAWKKVSAPAKSRRRTRASASGQPSRMGTRGGGTSPRRLTSSWRVSTPPPSVTTSSSRKTNSVPARRAVSPEASSSVPYSRLARSSRAAVATGRPTTV